MPKQCRLCGGIAEPCGENVFGEDVYECKNCKETGHHSRFEDVTLFTEITKSPEVLAEKSVYAHECCRIPDGATSPFIDEIFWFDDEKGDTWDERFDSAWEKAIAATVAKLNEVIEHA